MTGAPAQTPLVSIIIPAYNAEATLAETVASALGGSYRAFEIIVVDDGSSDRTAEIARQVTSADERVRLVQSERNLGLSAALNLGFAEARGDYLARLDADDIWHPDKLAKQVALATANPRAAFIYSFIRYIDDESLVVRDGPPQHFPPRALCRSIYETIVGSGSTALLRASAVAEAAILDETLRCQEDLFVQVEMSARHEIACVPEYLAGYRLKPASLSRDTDMMLAVWQQLRRRFRAQFREVPGYVHRWAHGSRCTHFAESYAWAGRYGSSAALLLTALWSDPLWTMRFLQYRIARFVRRRLSSRSTIQKPPFFQCDPREELRDGRYEADAHGGVLKRIHERRAAKLETLDRRLAGQA